MLGHYTGGRSCANTGECTVIVGALFFDGSRAFTERTMLSFGNYVDFGLIGLVVKFLSASEKMSTVCMIRSNAENQALTR